MPPTKKETEDGKRISELFENMSDRDKIMAMAYVSALRDKEVLEETKRQKSEELITQ